MFKRTGEAALSPVIIQGDTSAPVSGNVATVLPPSLLSFVRWGKVYISGH